ncbi:RodZ domain-containing protein [Patescibacteria group bacterium]
MTNFTTKKIANRLTLGERLRKARLKCELSLDSAEHLTKIKKKYLEALESNDYNSLPSATYIRCFIRTYARVLNLSASELLNQYKQEGEFETSKFDSDFSQKKDLQKPTFVLTPTKIASFIIGVVILIFGGYVWFQVSGFAAAPEIKLTNPKSNKTEITASSIELKGKTDAGSNLFLNQQALGIDTKGKFKVEIRLKEGANLLELISENKLGKQTKKTITVIARLPKLSPEILGNKTENGLNLSLEAGPDSSWVMVYADQKLIFRGVMLAKTRQQFFATNSFSINTTNAGSLHIFLNGQDLGTAGAKNQTRALKYTKKDLKK